MCDDLIQILGLSASTRVGVPVEERAQAQGVKFNVTLWPAAGFSGLNDDLSRAVDYDAAARLVRQVAGSGERRLIETLAEDVAAALLREFPLRRVRLEVLKFVLPDTQAVAVQITRERTPPASASG